MRGLWQDPDATAVLGRQPALVKWTPSNPFIWYGSIDPAERFTAQQHQTLLSKGIDPLTVPAITVKRQALRAEHCWSFYELPPVFVMECPVIGKAKDGRPRIIAPNGDVKLVQANGWGHRPYRLPDHYSLDAAMGGRR